MVQINEAGQLEVATPLEDFQEDKPYAYQDVEGQRLEVEAAYSLERETSDGVQFGFCVGAPTTRTRCWCSTPSSCSTLATSAARTPMPVGALPWTPRGAPTLPE